MATNGKKSKRKKIIIFSILGVVLVALAVIVFMGSKKEPIISVQVEKVARRTITQVVTATGKIQPEVQVQISPEVSGEIVSLPVKEGYHVKKGDLLMKIKPDVYIAQRNQFAAAVLQAKSALVKAEPDFRRSETLFKKGLISQADFDISRAGFESAKASLAQAQASLDQAEESLRKTTVTSPDGRDGQSVEFRAWRAGPGNATVPGDKRDDDCRSDEDGSPGGRQRERCDPRACR